ncbi:hypothetical protein ACFQVA_05950 [Actinomadura keratinilytica]
MVDPQQVVEDLRRTAVVLFHVAQVGGLLVHDGLHAACDVDEGALRGVAHGLLAVDDAQHVAQEDPLGVRQSAVDLAAVDHGAHDLGRGLVVRLEPPDTGRHELLGEVQDVVVVRGEPLLELGDLAGVLEPQGRGGAAPADRLGRDGDHHEGGGGSGDGDRYPGGLGDQGRGGSGGGRHQHGGQQQHPCE